MYGPMRFCLVVLVALVGCRSGDQRSATRATVEPSPVEPSRVEPAPGADPWNTPTTANPDDPPNLVERHRLAEEACPTVKGPYFYRIEKAGKISHILGTRHIGVPLTKFPPPVHGAIKTAKLAVFEVAPDDDSDSSQQEISLPTTLGPALWEHYRKLVGADLAQSLEQATPAAAVISLIALYEDVGAMLDMEIEREVTAAGIPTAGLETSAFQDKLLEQLLDIRMLRATIKHTKDRKELADDSRTDLAEYCAGTDEVPGMDEDMRADLAASGYTKAEIEHIDELMVYKRNADWIPKLEKILARGDVFIAVGADHLTGSRGVVALLAARGYRLTRITN